VKLDKEGMAQFNGNGTASKMIWWVLGIFGAVVLVFVSFIINKVETADTRLNLLDISISSMRERLNQTESAFSTVRNEQMDRTVKFGEINTKLALIDSNIKYLAERFNTISERILTINKRLDRLPSLYQEQKEPN